MADATTAGADIIKGGEKPDRETKHKSRIAEKVQGLTKQQRIMGGLIACIALTIATIVMLQPDIVYRNTQQGGQQAATGTGTTGTKDTGTTATSATTIPKPSPAAQTATSASSPSTTSSSGSGATTAGSPASSPSTTSKTYGVSGSGDQGDTGDTQSLPLSSGVVHWSDPSVMLAQHATPQNITQAQLDAWDSLTAPGITYPDSQTQPQAQQSADSQTQPATPMTDEPISTADSSVAPPEIRASKMELTLSAKHEHEAYHAHDDLNINEWQDGYYVLHRNSPAGDDIFSLRVGDVVHIDGMDCTVQKSIDVSASEYFEDIRDMVGWDTVVFHTCHRPASAGLVRIVACKPSVSRTFGVWHDGELIDANTWMNRISN